MMIDACRFEMSPRVHATRRKHASHDPPPQPETIISEPMHASLLLQPANPFEARILVRAHHPQA